MSEISGVFLLRLFKVVLECKGPDSVPSAFRELLSHMSALGSRWNHCSSFTLYSGILILPYDLLFQIIVTSFLLLWKIPLMVKAFSKCYEA